MSATIVSLEEYKAARAHQVCRSSQRSVGQILFGSQSPGHQCPHCGEELAEAQAMPHALNGLGCRECEVWYYK